MPVRPSRTTDALARFVISARVAPPSRAHYLVPLYQYPRLQLGQLSLQPFSVFQARQLLLATATFAMSDSENDASVLGKRTRNGEDLENGGKAEDVERPDQMDADDDDDDDDDDIGPMPMPASAEGHVAKKKRKGAFLCNARDFSMLTAP